MDYQNIYNQKWILILNAILFLFCEVILAGHEDKYIGYELSHSPSHIFVNTGRRITLLKQVTFRKGRVTHFHGLFGGTSSFHFQIWRRVWSPRSVENYMLVADHNITTSPGNFTLDVTGDNVLTEEGDRLGFLNDGLGRTPVLASVVSFYKTSTLFYGLTLSEDLPEVGKVIAFDGLEYPFTFTMGATYIPDVHEQGIVIGATGSTGATGPIGRKGDTGEMGPQGEAGAPGPSGSPGEPGLPGPKGDIGSTGPIGATGATGAPGLNGTKGEPGPLGVQGPKGDQGPPGMNGTYGSLGDTGATGPQGEAGPQGPIGRPGLQGNVGATGATGPAGAPGIKGDSGRLGATGPQGYTGPVGDPGLMGPPGPPGFFNGTYSVAIASFNMDACEDTVLECQHFCNVTVYGEAKCGCRNGYMLHTDGKTCIDTDECAIANGGCQMVCVNFEGSYKCQCNQGLKLSPNGHTCVDILECDVNNGDCQTESCIELYSSNLCLAKSSGYGVIVPDEAESKNPEYTDLLTHKVVMGLIIWLALLTLLILLVLLCCCMQRNRHIKEKRLYQRYVESLRHGTY